MSAGDNQIYPNSNTYTGFSMLEQAFEDLLANGINENINMNGFRITGAGNAVNAQDYVTLSQVQSGVPTSERLDQISTANPNVTSVFMNNQKLTSLAPGTLSTDAVNLSQLTTASSQPLNVISTSHVNTGSIQMNGYGLLNTSSIQSTDGNSNIDLAVANQIQLNSSGSVQVNIGASLALEVNATALQMSEPIDMQGNNIVNAQAIQSKSGDNLELLNSTSTNKIVIKDASNEIDLVINSQQIATITNQPDQNGIQVDSSQFTLQTLGDNTETNNFNMYGNRSSTGTFDSTTLNLLQHDYTSTNSCICNIDMGIAGGLQNLQFGSGFINFEPVGKQYVNFMQSLSANNNQTVISPGIALSNNSLVMYPDQNTTVTDYLRTQFTEPTGYYTGTSIAITDPLQFTTKTYVDSHTTSQTIQQIFNANGGTLDFSTTPVQTAEVQGYTANSGQLLLEDNSGVSKVTLDNSSVKINDTTNSNQIQLNSSGINIHDSALNAINLNPSIPNVVVYVANVPIYVVTSAGVDFQTFYLRSTYVPLIANDITNKLYVDQQITNAETFATNAIGNNSSIQFYSSGSYPTGLLGSQVKCNDFANGVTMQLDTISYNDYINFTGQLSNSGGVNTGVIMTTNGVFKFANNATGIFPNIAYIDVGGMQIRNGSTAGSTSSNITTLADVTSAIFNLSLTQLCANQPGSITTNGSLVTSYSYPSLSASGNQLINYNQVNANFLSVASTLQSIYTAHPSDLNMGSNLLQTTHLATLNQDVINLQYFNAHSGTTSQSLAQIAAANASVSAITASSQQITNLASGGTTSTNAINYGDLTGYAMPKTQTLNAQSIANPLTGNIVMNSNGLTGCSEVSSASNCQMVLINSGGNGQIQLAAGQTSNPVFFNFQQSGAPTESQINFTNSADNLTIADFQVNGTTYMSMQSASPQVLMEVLLNLNDNNISGFNALSSFSSPTTTYSMTTNHSFNVASVLVMSITSSQISCDQPINMNGNNITAIGQLTSNTATLPINVSAYTINLGNLGSGPSIFSSSNSLYVSAVGGGTYTSQLQLLNSTSGTAVLHLGTLASPTLLTFGGATTSSAQINQATEIDLQINSVTQAAITSNNITCKSGLTLQVDDIVNSGNTQSFVTMPTSGLKITGFANNQSYSSYNDYAGTPALLNTQWGFVSGSSGLVNVSLDVAQRAVFRAEIDYLSDARCKTTIFEESYILGDVIEGIKTLPFQCYEWKDKERHGNLRHVGYYAQDVGERFPAMVLCNKSPEEGTDDGIFLSVDKMQLSEAGLMCTKHLLLENEQLKKRIDRLESLVEQLLSR